VMVLFLGLGAASAVDAFIEISFANDLPSSALYTWSGSVAFHGCQQVGSCFSSMRGVRMFSDITQGFNRLFGFAGL